MKEIKLVEGKNELPFGWMATIKPRDPYKHVNPSRTSDHEAIHTVAAIKNNTHVIEASRIPGPGYLGFTELSNPDAIAAVAPHAFGHCGTGHDLNIVEIMGYDPHLLANTARKLLCGSEKEIHAVAALIEINGSISGFQAEEVMEQTENPEVDVEIVDPLGEKRQFVKKVRKSEGYFIPLDIAA